LHWWTRYCMYCWCKSKLALFLLYINIYGGDGPFHFSLLFNATFLYRLLNITLQTGFFGGIAYLGSDSYFGLIFLYDDRCDYAYGNNQVRTSVPSDEGKKGHFPIRSCVPHRCTTSSVRRLPSPAQGCLATSFSSTGGASLWEAAAASTMGVAHWGYRTRPMAGGWRNRSWGVHGQRSCRTAAILLRHRDLALDPAVQRFAWPPARFCWKCMHVASVRFKCFRCSKGMLQVYSYGCCKSRSRCCIRCNGYTRMFQPSVPNVSFVLKRMLQVFYLDVAYVSHICYKCFIWMLHMFDNDF
jgi:hypothetical protein